jgi:putative serine protease PepD
VKVKFWNGKVYAGKIVGTDASTDLAVVHVDAPASLLHPLTLADSDAVQVGDPVIAIGSPFGLPETVTNGIVSALDRTIQSPTTNSNPNPSAIGGAIQTDAAINHGNSGGPLIDAYGRVIGVNSQIQSSGGGSNGVGFAIPSNTVKNIATQLIAGKAVKHAFMGVELADSASPPGALLQQVIAGSGAAKAGLKGGDVVVSVDGQTVSSGDDLSSAIDQHRAGDKVTVTYVRDGKQHTVTVTLGARST